MDSASPRIVVLISGSGSNLQALINACQRGLVGGKVVKVISNRPDVYGLSRAEQAGIESQVLDHKHFESREEFDTALADMIDQAQPDWIALAGFMRILTPAFVSRYIGKMINIHPSLLPKFPGLHTHQRVLDERETHHGASVHFVIPELDAGPVITQGKIAILAEDTADSLAARVLQIEHKIYPQALKLLIEGKIKYHDQTAYLENEPLPPNGYQTAYDL